MKNSGLVIHPYIRLFFFISSLAGCWLTNDLILLGGFYIILLLPIIIFNDQLGGHSKLMLAGILPVYLSFILLYILVLDGAKGGWSFVNLRMAKIIIYTSTFQIVLSIPTLFLFDTLKKWRLKGQPLILIMSSFTVWEDVKYRAGKIIDARFARGFIKKRTILNQARQLPFMLLPLTIGVSRVAIDRAECWEQKNMLHLVAAMEIKKIDYPIFLNIVILALSFGWFMLALLSYLYHA